MESLVRMVLQGLAALQGLVVQAVLQEHLQQVVLQVQQELAVQQELVVLQVQVEQHRVPGTDFVLGCEEMAVPTMIRNVFEHRDHGLEIDRLTKRTQSPPRPKISRLPGSGTA